MADSYIRVPADSVGKRVDTDELTVGSTTVERQRVRVGGAAATELADVRNTVPGTTDHGLAIRAVPGSISTGAVQPTGTLTSAPGIADDQDFYLDGVLLTNNSAASVNIEVTDGAGSAIIPTMAWPGFASQAIPFFGMPITGLKWAATGGPGPVIMRAWGH